MQYDHNATSHDHAKSTHQSVLDSCGRWYHPL